MVGERHVPKMSLARIFPNGFPEFWQRTKLKESLGEVRYDYIPATTTTEEAYKSLLSGYGMNAVFIAKHFFIKYQYRTFEPYEDDFISQFSTEIIFVIAEVRRSEWLWQDVFRNIKQWLKPLKLTTDARTSKNYDLTRTNRGTDKANQAYSETNQGVQGRNIKQDNIPLYSQTDLTGGGYGSFNRQSQMSVHTNEQGSDQGTRTKKGLLDKKGLANIQQKDFTIKDSWRQNKDSNVNTVKQEIYELNSISRLLNNFQLTIIDFSKFYPRFNRLFEKMFGCTVVPVYDPETGRRRWVSQGEYEEIVAEETGTQKPPEGNEWDETLPYLERLKINKGKIEKELKKLPDTSNRKPRIALRQQIAEGCVKAYEKEAQGISLPSVEEFRTRCRGEREGYQKIIGYENIIETICDYLEGWEFYKEYGGEMPDQLMLFLLGEPGLGKSYISQAIAKSLDRGFHVVSMNGKADKSIVYGTGIENPGAEPGEIVKAISRREDSACVILFDELEKAKKDAKRALGNPTDRTQNKLFKDDFFDFPTPCNNIIFIGTGNYPEDLPDFAEDRFRIIFVQPLGYEQRIEVLKNILKGKLKSFDQAFRRIYDKDWEEIYELFSQEELLKKTLTKSMSIRGSKDNIILSLVPTLKSKFLVPKRPLPKDIVDYDWKFIKKEQIDKGDPDRNWPACPYSVNRENEHRERCRCFVANLDKVEGWEENMEGY